MLRASFVAYAALVRALATLTGLAPPLLLGAAPLGLALLAVPAAAFTVEVRARADSLIVDLRPKEGRSRIRAVDPATLETTTISERSFLMAPIGIELAANGDLLISEYPGRADGADRIRPVAADTPASGVNLRHLDRLDVFVIAGGPREAGGVFTAYLADGTSALFIDGRFLTDPPRVPVEFPSSALVSEIDSGTTLLIPLHSGAGGVVSFVVEDLFEVADEARASIDAGDLAPGPVVVPAASESGDESRPTGALRRR
jgi:hypothetical protein